MFYLIELQSRKIDWLKCDMSTFQSHKPSGAFQQGIHNLFSGITNNSLVD